MPRLLTGDSIFRKPTALDLYRIQTGTIGDTVTTAPIVGDGSEATVAVTASTNFTNGDPVFTIGDGGVELLKIGAPNLSMPVSYKPKIPQSTGARFVEAVKVPLGKPTDDGIQITPSKQLTEVFSAIDDVAVAFIDGPLSLQCTMPLLEYSGLNWQLMTGYADEETGAGSAADPYQYVIGKLNQTLQGTVVIRMSGLRHDGKFLQWDLLDARAEVSQGIDHNRQAPSKLVATMKFSRMILRQATAAFTN